ncbi:MULTISPECIES: ABC transporter substrate-binding protein [unclassified Pseudovibrio]|uniref:ABC transporter substrate-binding protein n=1 Tax=unclassified Pseudovibrio TaxID=2627060 RepID=UPI0007AE6F72|nr:MULTISPECIES: ABC transporter substrate-binding protein [unclassified Pseudovibrio]KZK94987.1 putative aliphatic sulfonates-binding protein precursor [Pseudovibrio sp. W74]KZL08790.1 putative aliphatic sulfonates-binding protein precursor [Pseudovibrio sp. Ad14]
MKVRGILSGVLMGAAVLTGTFATTATAAEKITVGALRFTSHAANFVAFEKGYFNEAGLEVEFKFFQAAQPMALAIASGDVDFGLTAISGGLISLADKGAVKVIGGALQEEAGIDGQMILASKAAFDAGLKTPADLKGKSFGVTTAGSSFHYMAHKIADKEGFERKDIKIRPLQKVGAVIGALKSGQIDAWSIVPHIAKGLAKSPQVEMIGKVSDYVPNYQVTTVFTSAKNINSNPELVKTFLGAYSKGAADFNAALVDKSAGDAAAEDMVKLIHKYVYADRPYEKAAPSIRNGAMRLNEGAALNMASVEDQLNWFKSEKLVPAGVTLDKLVDVKFVETF